MSSEGWSLGSPAGEQGASTRGTVGTDAPGGGFAPIVRLAACAYAGVGAAVAWIAFLLAPWGLLLLIVALGAFGAAAICGLMAVGFAEVEGDKS